jgi:Zn-dependent M16 (insulinase) family peptidase
MFSPVATKGGFKFIENYSIEVLGVEVQYYEHQKTGAKHYHFACDDNNKTFMVALRTLPMSSNGVAHILEHLVLCGSSNFPVRDPFFLMLRRSLSNFMNAFTASDWTAYPFATQNDKDFDNLLKVYLDAVFFPNLDKLDFDQEGWRLHVDFPGEKAEVQYKGVVFNEMKGAMSSPTRQLWHHLCRHLFTETTYHFNSGGNPLDIPSLTHQELLDFHQCYYHPSNAVFFSYGNLEPSQLQQEIESLVLYSFEKKEDIPRLSDDIRFNKPKNVTEYYPVEQKSENTTHIVVSWLLDDSLEIMPLLEANLLNLLLFDNASSPMQKLLENTPLGSSPSQINGLEDEMREMVFTIGLEGCDEKAAKQVEKLIMNELSRLMEEGIPASQVEACMHQLELAQRDVSGGGMPTGLNLLLSVILPSIHNAGIGQHLDIDSSLKELKEKSQDTDFIKSLIAKLYNNPHRVCLRMCPDETLQAKNLAAENQQLDDWKAKLDETQQKKIQRENRELDKRQIEPQNAEILPTISVDDIKAECDFANPTKQGKDYTYYKTRCNGLVYVNGIMQLPALSPEQSQFLPLLNAMMSEVGVGERSYLEVQENISRYTGGISLKPHLWQSLSKKQENNQDLHLRMAIGSMSLMDNCNELFSLMQNNLLSPRFDESHHIKELINQLSSSSFYSIASSGHILAMQMASSHFSPSAAIGVNWSGLSAIHQLLELRKSFSSDQNYEQFITEIESLYQTISSQWQTQWLLVSDEQNQSPLLKSFEKQITKHQKQKNEKKASIISALKETPALSYNKTVWSIDSDVNYCASAYSAVPIEHSDAPIFSVLSNYLRNAYLHTAIREQGGAYGGGCNYDALSATFRFFSYRDPRLHETYEDFSNAIKKASKNTIRARDVQEAIFNAVSKVDAPSSPSDTVKQDFYASLRGIDKEFRERYKQNLLKVNADDMVRVIESYLLNKEPSLSVITGHKQAQKLSQSEGYQHTSIIL